MKRTCWSIVLVAGVVFIFAAAAFAQSVTILGGGLKGQPYQFAVGLSKILKSKAGIAATPQSAKGMVAQARIIAKGQAQFAWGLGGPVGAWAYKGERRFKKEGPKKNLRAVLETRGLAEGELARRLEQLLGELNLKALASQRADELSGGETRRVEIARALAIEPRYMLLDEPFAGIDPRTVEDIQNIVADLRRKGLGILITDHNVRETLEITDRAYIMVDGRILTAGGARELITDPQVRSIYLGERFQLGPT